LPIGAYLFNPAAANVSVAGQTFTEWYIDEYLFGKNGGSNPNISGFFFDDQFHPTGATESAGSLANLGLSKEQGAQISQQYWALMNTVYDTVIKRGKFAWQLLWTGQKHCAYMNSHDCLGTTRTNILVQKRNCTQALRKMCTKDSDAQTRAMMFPFQGKDPSQLPFFEQVKPSSYLLVVSVLPFAGHYSLPVGHSPKFVSTCSSNLNVVRRTSLPSF
jgi:hypothetical protein